MTPIVSLIAAAAVTDPEIAVRWPAGPDPRHTVQHVAAKALASKPDARPDVDSARAADPLYGLLSQSCSWSLSATGTGPPRCGKSGPARPSPPTSALIRSRPLILAATAAGE
ncbi:hypothetical protein [Streptomyces halstedii]|uniref:Uncharacterized protein n=1 Tax=Streptomyces halstedii TaxID=1944 RepID=A0A6N9U688_STRHA|nr:hypothetical protein [Streptomyces halstedii]NEA19344.1 hypothetical protein [Streptomyces halstedii]